jgi:hypothetical protein
MNNSRFPKALIEYHPREIRRPGRPLKRLLDGVQIDRPHGPNFVMEYDDAFYIYVFRMILTVNSDYFFKQR